MSATHRAEQARETETGEVVWLQQTGQGRWRVLDSRFEADDERSLLGFIDRHGSSIHATRVGSRDVSRHCSSLDEARELFTSEIEVGPSRVSWTAIARRLHLTA